MSHMQFVTPHPGDVQREELRHRRIAEYLQAHFTGSLGPYPLPGGVALPPAAPSSLPRSEPTQHEKARALFSQLDANRSAKIEEDEWVQGLNSVNLGLEEEAIKELYQELGDGGLPAWTAFAGQHTMLTEALYWRHKRLTEAEADKKAAESATSTTRATVERSEEALEKSAQTQEGEEKNLQDAKDEEERLQKELDQVQDRFREAVQESDRRVTATSEAKREVARLWPETQRKMGELRTAEMSVQGLTLRSKAAAENERQLEAALEAAKRDRERVEEDLRKAEELRDGLQEEMKNAQEPEEKVRETESALAAAQREEQQLSDELRSARVTTDAQQHKRQSLEGRAEAAKDQVEAAKSRVQKAKDDVSAQEERFTEASATLDHGPGKDADGQLTEEAEKENKLVQEQITLLKDRRALERREAAFHQEANTFTGSPQRRAGALAAPPAAPPAATSPPTSA